MFGTCRFIAKNIKRHNTAHNYYFYELCLYFLWHWFYNQVTKIRTHGSLFKSNIFPKRASKSVLKWSRVNIVRVPVGQSTFVWYSVRIVLDSVMGLSVLVPCNKITNPLNRNHHNHPHYCFPEKYTKKQPLLNKTNPITMIEQ